MTDHFGDMGMAPEFADLDLPDRPDGPAAAAMLSAGVGIFVLGLLTVMAHASAPVNSALAAFDLGLGVGPLAGKSTVAILAWGIAWSLLHRAWKSRERDLRRAFVWGLALGLLGALGTFPPFFEAF